MDKANNKAKTLTIYQKLLECQKELGIIVKGKENPFFHSSYADINNYLEVVKPVLSKHGLVLLQPLQNDTTGNILTTKIVDADSNKLVESTIRLPENPDPQKMGSIITYFRRFAIQSLLALQAEDDDAQKASGEQAEVKATPKQIEYIYKLAKRRGAEDKSAALQMISEILDILITNIEELTKQQASQAIERLSQRTPESNAEWGDEGKTIDGDMSSKEQSKEAKQAEGVDNGEFER